MRGAGACVCGPTVLRVAKHGQGATGSDENLNRKFRIWSVKQKATQGRALDLRLGCVFERILCPRTCHLETQQCPRVAVPLGKAMASLRWGWVLSFHTPSTFRKAAPTKMVAE